MRGRPGHHSCHDLRRCSARPRTATGLQRPTSTTSFRPRGRPRSPTLRSLREPEAVGGWLVVTARREALRVIQRRQREIPVDQPYPEQNRTISAIEDTLLENERRDAVCAAVEQLPCNQRALIRALFSRAGPSYDDLAKNLGMPVGSIGPTRQRAFMRLRRNRQLVTLASPESPRATRDRHTALSRHASALVSFGE